MGIPKVGTTEYWIDDTSEYDIEAELIQTVEEAPKCRKQRQASRESHFSSDDETLALKRLKVTKKDQKGKYDDNEDNISSSPRSSPSDADSKCDVDVDCAEMVIGIRMISLLSNAAPLGISLIVHAKQELQTEMVIFHHSYVSYAIR